MILRPDDLLVAGPGRWERSAIAEAWAQCFRWLRAALASPQILRAGVLVGIPGAGKTTWSGVNDRVDTCLHDAVWADPRRRAQLAARVHAAGKTAIAIWVRTPIDVCLLRNAARPEWRRVPEDAMRSAAALLDRFPPSRAEGWDAVSIVDGTSSVRQAPVPI